ncbi:hypothetical protein QWY77_10045 [Thalassotalea ponticola]|uniref:hypothetical protein n=1 Tax=Thalassotalea ponticola TaxID=1523392 RepID=UPI0025B33DF1|nr:hypothetical protein [Thalassotalea ponticola]MDN3653095.1 hypothetical protein [Thalassotalea ponticola]
MLQPKWIKRFIAILVLSFAGFFLFLHAAMSSDTAIEIEWYYQLEMVVARLIWWPASIYLAIRKYIDSTFNILGFELWPIQFLGYFLLFKVFDKYKAQ